MLGPDDEVSPGYVKMTCRNHPSYRWTRKDPRVRRISQNIGLMFDGDIESGKRGLTTNDVSVRAFYESALKDDYVLECECPYEALEYVDPQVTADLEVAMQQRIADSLA